jgi:argininosuccinate lyase
MRERVKVAPSQVVIDYVFQPRLEYDRRDSFEPLMDLNRAHVVMLADRGIVPRAQAGQLMRILEQVRQAGAGAIHWDPALEEVYYNLEVHILAKAGPAIGGQLHTGRSRNDLFAALSRMSARRHLLQIATWLQETRQALLAQAERHAETIVTGYTHMQAAQPTTLGHYFHALAHALERDDVRLQQTYAVVNCCPLGACAFNATGFPIDRAQLADLTGFDGLVENSIDAVATRDYAPQILSALAILGTNLSRLAQDLYIWGTDEFGWIEVGDYVAATSSIMPQKKNPITLEHIRGKAGHLIAAVVGALTAQKGVLYSHLRDISFESTYPLGEGFQQAEAVLRLTTATLATLRVRGEKAEARAAENFSTVTELADVLVRECGLSFREAHNVVGAAVGDLVEQGGRTGDLTLDLLERMAQERLGRRLGLSPQSLARALSPAENVAVRAGVGGPAPAEVRRSVGASRDRMEAHRTWWEQQANHLARAREKLDRAAAELAKAS